MYNRTIFFLLLFLFGHADAATITVRTCLNRGATDYFSYLDSMKLPNPVKNLLAKISQDLEFKVNFENSEMNRCLKQAKDGEVDAVYPLIFSSAVEPFFEAPPEGAMISMVKWNVYTLSAPGREVQFKSIKDIKEPLGLLFDYKITNAVLAEGVSLEQTAKTPEDLLRQLLTGRVKAILMVHYEFAKARRSFNEAEISKINLNFTYREQPSYFLLAKKFSDKHPGFSKKFYSRLVIEKNKSSFLQEMDLLNKNLQ